MFLFILVDEYLGNNINTVIFWRFSFHLGRSKHLKCLMFIIKVIFEVLFDLWLDITLINEITIISLENVVEVSIPFEAAHYPLRISLVKVWVSAFCPTVRNLDTISSLYSKTYSHMYNYFYSLLSNTNPALLPSK